MVARWLEANRDAEAAGDWSILADYYAEDATYGWMYTPDEHFMAVGRDEIRELALGTEMAGLDGWHYDYAATVIDEQQGHGRRLLEAARRHRRRRDRPGVRDPRHRRLAGSATPATGQSPGSATGSTSATTAHTFLAIAGSRQGAAGPARPDGAARPDAAGPLPARRPALDRVAAGGGRLMSAIERPGAAHADRRQARRRERRRDVPDPQPGHRAGDRRRAPDATAADMDAAIAAARRAFDETDWSTNLELRVRCLRQLHQALVDHGEEMRALTTAEAGAPAFLTAGPQYDVPVEGAAAGRSTWPSRYEWETDLGVAEPMGIPTRRTIRREAVGVVAAITPWNFPNQINLAKVGPALAPATPSCSSRRRTPRGCACELGRLAAEHTDLPPGVLNVVTPRDNDVADAARHRPAGRPGLVHRLHRDRPRDHGRPPRRR